MRGHAAGLAADEADQIGAVDRAVGAFARIAADHADRERMRAGDAVLAVERSGDRNLQRFARARPAQHRRPRRARRRRRRKSGASRLCSRASAAFTWRCFRLGPERRHARELRLDQRLHLGFLDVHLALVAAELQMHGARRAGSGDAERLPHHVGNARHLVDGGVELGHRLERRHVVDFLINLSELGFRVAPAGHRDHRRMRQVSIAQAGGEIERADHLRHADAGLAGRARIAVGHVGGGFLAVTMHARDLGAPLHLGEAPPQHRRHHEDVGHAVARQHVGEHFGAGSFGVVANIGHCWSWLLRFTPAEISRPRR